MEIYIDDFTRDFPYELGSEMKFIETLGHGAFGTVIHVLDLTTNQDIAVKVINKDRTRHSYIDKLKEEISILRILNHPNIVKFYGYLETNNQLLIKMEYIKYGSLKKWIQKQEKITEEQSSTILRRVLSAVEYLHSKQICHRDIKPENIMLSKENDLDSIKIIDFGLSAQNFDKLINNDYCGTYIYMAPELIEKKLYFNSVDIWSIGILMFILLNKGKHPFYTKGDKREEIAKRIKEGKINFYEKVSPMAKHLIKKLLEPNPSWRYTASQAIKHPWITRNVNDTPPITFNELLVRSNNKKILKDLFNTCLFMNFFLKKEDFKFIINKKYIKKCDYFSEMKRNKLIKKKEKCLEVENNNDEEEKNQYFKNFEENLPHKRIISKVVPYTVLSRNRGKSMKIISKQKLSFDKRGSKKAKTNGSNKVIYLLKKYQNDKTNLKFENQNTAITNDPKFNMKKSVSLFFKVEKKRNINPIKNFETLTANKTNFINMFHKINEENNNEKNYEEIKKKQINSIYTIEKPQKVYNYLSSKKLRNNFPKLGNMKRSNLFQKNKHISLNCIYNCIPIILPNLGKIGQRKEQNEKLITKTFIKNADVIKIN